MINSPGPVVPNFIIIGAPKSGTTSLFYYLKQHPDIYLPNRKELHYFTYDLLRENANGPGDRHIITTLCTTRGEYESYYRGVSGQRMIGEVSPSYLYYSSVSERILSELGKIKIIAILRNPVEKAYSQYMHLVRDNLETLTFYNALMKEEERRALGWSDIWRYAESSLYMDRLETYKKVFGPDNVKILFFDDLISDPDNLMRDIFIYLCVNADIRCDTSKTYNRSGKPRFRLIADFFAKPNIIKDIAKRILPDRIRIPLRIALHSLNTGRKDPMDERSKKYLLKYFQKDIESLEGMIARKLHWLE